MSEEQARVNLVLPSSQKEKWEDYADNHSVVDSVSALVRMSVEKEIEDTERTQEIREVVSEIVERQSSNDEEILREVKNIRRSQLSEDDVANLVTSSTVANDDFYDIIRQALADEIDEQEVDLLAQDMIESLLTEAENDE